MSDNTAIDHVGSYLFPTGIPKRKSKKAGAKKLVPVTPTKKLVLRSLRKSELSVEWFWGLGNSMSELRQDLQYSIGSNLNVLLVGETGTGKELLARKIHNERKRLSLLSDNDAPFVSINCSTIPEALAESILFGHERGAFTSARDKQFGKFELARQGTLFLDEIQSLPLEVQAKLLRAIQEREVERIGAKESYKIECKIIAASNIPLELLVETNKFRRDLYYRLNICPLYIPSVRSRKEDFPVLLKGLLDKVCEEIRCLTPEISPAAYELMASHPWPGNLREIEHTLTYAVLRCSGVIDLVHLPPSITGKLNHFLSTGDWV